MALAGSRGVVLEKAPSSLPAYAFWFGEDQARYLVAVSPNHVSTVRDAADAFGVPVRTVGTVGGDAIALPDDVPLSLSTLRASHEGWLPRFMSPG